ncbi:hypothetical protein RISK_001250 [Rhodopirellula islandica]|uniref:Uncharacterized protein n=1 Tax=Rhodopirellula islandica TaxID=595434 RepID=A0A0J1BJE2_RHOIS|nr:hypothetical protein RISK_001250 [Rhodopirellula islandica]
MLWDTLVQFEPLTASREIVLADTAFVPNTASNLHWVRGPPSV